MIKRLILINSANFNFLDINLEKDLFFLGDNGSGKTTAIRAIHYLYSGDVRNLGIPADKDGFKEYYFRYPNSYIIYVFENFFIFMYKTGAEIVKIFSYQKFNLDEIIDKDLELNELQYIKKYVKKPNLKKTVKSLSEYRDIIYGNNKKLQDFKFTNIKNSNIFIGLFNEIFNIDKSIIDSKSIKRAIQTTLDYDKKVIEFDHDKYLQDIYKYQSKYKFFKEFEKQKDTIDSAYNIKNQLLEFENEIDELLESIKYGYEKESEILSRSESEYKNIKERLSKYNSLKLKRKKLLEKCETVFQKYFNDLILDIERIKELKIKFSYENILLNRDKADKYKEIQEKYNSINLSYEKLKSGYENQLVSIESEIESLEYKRDKVLSRELEDKKDNKKRFLLSKLKEKIEKKELEFVTKKNSAKIDKQNIFFEIKEFDKDINKLKEESQKLEAMFIENKKLLIKDYEKRESDKRKQIRDNISIIDEKNRDIKNFDFNIKNLKNLKNRRQEENRENYEVEIKRIDSKIQEYKSMIESKLNSFKEFLDEEVDAWESELYPILDSKLLNMDRDILSPKLLDAQSLFAIELNTKSLKSILTKDEANDKISEHSLELENLELSYEESIKVINKNYKDDKEKTESKKETIKIEIENLEDKNTSLIVELDELEKEFVNKNEIEQSRYNSQNKQLNQEIKSFESEIIFSREAIEDIENTLATDKRVLNKAIEDFEFDYDEDFKSECKKLDSWLKDEIHKVEKLIDELDLKKESITQDDRLKELESLRNKLDAQRRESIKAQSFLEEYEDSKDKLSSLLSLKNILENKNIKYSEFRYRLDLKIENYIFDIESLEKEKEVLLERDKQLRKGLSSFNKLELDLDDVVASEDSRYLYELTENYSNILQNNKKQKIELQVLLNKINKIENTQKDIDIYFNFDEYYSDEFISQNIEMIDKINEIYQYKNKTLEMAKQSSHKQFVNFIEGFIPQKMSILNDSEDKFIEKIIKINNNLSDIDFGVIKNIRLNHAKDDKKSIAKLLNDIRENVLTLNSLLNEGSLFYEKSSVLSELSKLELKFKEIKTELKGSSISLVDTIDLSLSFNENGKIIKQVSQLKNESSTGGSMLLKIAIAISILQLFVKEENTPFFLIVDEVSRLHSDNQEKLREFANSKGFSIVFVTPEPTYSKPKVIKYYRFKKNIDNEFEAIELNR